MVITISAIFLVYKAELAKDKAERNTLEASTAKLFASEEARFKLFSSREVLNPEAWRLLQKDVFNDKIPVLDHIWQRESSDSMIANFYGLGLLAVEPCSAGFPVPGLAADIVYKRRFNS